MTALDNPAPFTLTVPITLRTATCEDLPLLEWHGQYRHYRNLIQRAYREQLHGRRQMIVADFNGFPIGQIYVQLVAGNRRIADGRQRAYLYAFRVMDLFRGQGIGSTMMHYVEGELIQRGYQWATIAVAKDNEGALRLYRRLSYRPFDEDPGQWQYVDHKGITRHVDEPCWIMEKRLSLR